MEDGPLTDKVRLTGCRTCHRAILTALCEGVVATNADPVILTPPAELALLLTGGTSYALGPDPIVDRDGQVIWQSPLRLFFRTADGIRLHPGRGIAGHVCGRDHGPPDPAVLRHRPRAVTWPDDPNVIPLTGGTA
jgi:hypothetical protein